MLKRKCVVGKAKKLLAVTLAGMMIAGLVQIPGVGALKVSAASNFKKTYTNTYYGIYGVEKNKPSGKIGRWAYVWYGQTLEGEPLKCRVLSLDTATDTGNEYKTVDSSLSSHKLMLLDSETSIGMKPFEHGWYVDSPIKTKLDSVWSSGFDIREHNAVPKVSAEDKYIETHTSYSGHDAPFTDNLFILGYADITNSNLGYSANTQNNDRKGKHWDTWTRCVLKDGYNLTYNVMILESSGATKQYHCTYNLDVYPSFCVDENEVLFSSFTGWNPDNPNVYDAMCKLTVYDKEMVVSLPSGKDAYVYPDSKTIAIPYQITGENAGKAEQMSVYILDSSNKLKHYIPLNTGSSKVGNNGVGTFELPKDISLDQIGSTYKLYLIAEDINDEKHTDFASKGCPITSFDDIEYVGNGTTDNITVKNGAVDNSKLTIKAPKSLQYDGKEKRAYTNDYDKELFPGTVDAFKINYYTDDVKPGYLLKDRESVTDPGDYAAELVYTNGSKSYSAKVLFTITQGEPAEKVHPKPNTLTENGSEQALITEGTVENGTMYYALGDGSLSAPSEGEFKTSVPTAKDAGTYYVWYMTKGDKNYEDIPPTYITVTIQKKADQSGDGGNNGGENSGENGNGGSNGGENGNGGSNGGENGNTGNNGGENGNTGNNGGENGNTGNNGGENGNGGNTGENVNDNTGENTGDNGNSGTGNTDSGTAPAAKNTTISNASASYVVTNDDQSNPTVTYTATKKVTDTTITIPATVKIKQVTYKITEVSPKAFRKNTKVKTVKIGKNVTKIGAQAFQGCSALESVTGGSGVRIIGANAFNGCVKLKKAPIGAKVTSIGDKAFYNCAAMTTMVIPASTTKLGKQFAGKTPKMQTVTVKSKKLKDKNIKAGAFKGMGGKKTTVRVQKGMVKTYKPLFKNKGLNKKIKIKESK